MTGRLIANVGSVLSSEVLHRAATFAVYLLVARYLDPEAFGRLSLALTLLYAAQVTAGFGLRTYIAREAAKDRGAAAGYLAHGVTVVVVASAGTLAALVALVAAADYAAPTAAAVLLLALAAVPHAIGSVCEGLFQAFERMHLIAVVNVPVNVVKVAAAVLVLEGGMGLTAVLLTLVVAQTVIAALQIVLALRLVAGTRPVRRLDVGRSARLARGAATFMGIEGTIAVWASLPIVLLSLLHTEIEVGIFAAAAQLMVPVTLVVQSVTVAVFPMMARLFAQGVGELRNPSQGLLGAMLALALPAAAGLFVVAPEVLILVYGDPAFEAAAIALRVMVVMIVFRAVTSALGQVLLAGMRERITLRIVALNSAATLGLSLLLIPSYGVVGAAVAAALAGALNVVQHAVPVSRMLGGIGFGAAAWRPAVATAAMTLVLIAVDVASVIATIAIGALVYGVVLAGLFLATTRRPRTSQVGLAQTWRRP